MGFNNFGGGGFGGGGMNMQAMVKQAQEMQAKMEKGRAEINATEIKTTSGGGVVSVVMMGSGEVKSIKIDKAVCDPDDTETLEDLIIACLNEARNRMEQLKKEKLGQFEGLI